MDPGSGYGPIWGTPESPIWGVSETHIWSILGCPLPVVTESRYWIMNTSEWHTTWSVCGSLPYGGTLQTVCFETPFGRSQTMVYHILRMYPGSTDPGIWCLLELRCQGIWGPSDPMDPGSWLSVTHWIRVFGTPLNHGSWVWIWSHMGYPEITHFGCFGDPYLVHSGMSPSCRYRIQVLDSGRLGMVPQMSHLGVPTPTGVPSKWSVWRPLLGGLKPWYITSSGSIPDLRILGYGVSWSYAPRGSRDPWILWILGLGYRGPIGLGCLGHP